MLAHHFKSSACIVNVLIWITDITKEVPSSLWKLMSAYLALGLVAVFLTMLCLDKIGAKIEPEKKGQEVSKLLVIPW